MRSPVLTPPARSAAVIDPTPIQPRPFLKWAGGKRQLLPQLRRFVPAEFSAYHEPFLGSGAMFFDLSANGRLGSRGARLVDTNADLIGCYSSLHRDVDAVISELKRFEKGRSADPSEHYYRVRDDLFNPARRHRIAGSPAEYPANLAAMFIYLNRTGFNGLYRLNSKGAFNVPIGRYLNPRICDELNLRAVARVLSATGVALSHDGYESVLDAASASDLVYFDPPYAPLSTTARFTSYTAGGFSDDDHRRLQAVVLELVGRRCWVVLSNSTAPIISDLYETDRQVKRAGLHAYRVPAKRAINSDPTARGSVMEFIITNVPPRD